MLKLEAMSLSTRYSDAMDVLSLFLEEIAFGNDTPSSLPVLFFTITIMTMITMTDGDL